MGRRDVSAEISAAVDRRIWSTQAPDLPALDATQSAALLEQYKLYVEMTDRVSARRGLTNTFFLTLNGVIFTLVGVFSTDKPDIDAGWLALPLAIALGQCLAWFALVRAHRQLAAGKFAVIDALERALPARPYTAEWEGLGRGGDLRRYTPMTYVETAIPALFAAVYVVGFLAVLL